MSREKNESKVTAIVALGEKTRAIGKNNELLWKIPGDLARFKEITTGHPVIMGYKTFQSMGEKLLPNRTNIILSSDKGFLLENAHVVHTKEEALKIARESEGAENIFIIGGGQIYELLLPETDTLDLTVVHSDIEGDTYFPEYLEFSKTISEEQHSKEIPSFTRKILRRP